MLVTGFRPILICFSIARQNIREAALEMSENNITPLESENRALVREHEKSLSAWIKVGTIAAASAVVGGLAAAWFYRKTLDTFREAEPGEENSEFGSTKGQADSDT